MSNVSVSITYQTVQLPVYNLRWKMSVGVEPSYCHLYCLKSQVASFKSTSVGTLVITTATHTLTIENMYFISARGTGTVGAEDLCELVLADCRITFASRGTIFANDYNTFTVDRTATAAYTINSVSRTLATMENLNSAAPWTFKTLTDKWIADGAELAIAADVDTIKTLPVDMVPRQLLGTGGTVASILQQLLWQSNTYLVYKPRIAPAINKWWIIHRLGAVQVDDTTELAAFDNYKLMTRAMDVGLKELTLGTSLSGVAPVPLALDTASHLYKSLYTDAAPTYGALLYEYHNIEPVITDATQLTAWYTEWITRIKYGIEQQAPSEIEYGGLLPIWLSSIVQEVEWIMDATTCKTIVRRFYTPTPRPIEPPNTFHAYGMFPAGGSSSGSGSTTLKAYCQANAGASATIICYLTTPDIYVSAWTPTTTFAAGQLVTYNDKHWVSLQAANLKQLPGNGTAWWKEILAYNETTVYNPTTEKWCLYNYQLWRCLKAANLAHTPAEDTWWTLKAPTYSAGTAYIAGDRVFYKKQGYDQGKVWVCSTAGTGKIPSQGAYWELVETKNYCTSITYGANTLVTYDSKFWRSRATLNKGNLPVEGVYWTEVVVAAYVDATTYAAGTQVLSDTKLWTSIAGGNQGHLPVGSTYWTELVEVEVYCNIACGSKLQFAVPLLLAQQEIDVEYSTANSRYEAKQLFQACEETAAEGALLEIVSEMTLQDFDTVVYGDDWARAELMGHGLRIAAEANSTYVIEYAIIYDSSSNTNGIKLQLKAIVAPLSLSGMFYGTNDASIVGFPVSAVETPVTFSKNSAGAKFIRGDFILKTDTTGGEFYLEFATEASGGWVKILTGSNIKSRRTQWELPV
jgi:hypothetical protein